MDLLPLDIFQHILESLSPKSISRLSLTCRSLRDRTCKVCEKEIFWKFMQGRDFPEEIPTEMSKLEYVKAYSKNLQISSISVLFPAFESIFYKELVKFLEEGGESYSDYHGKYVYGKPGIFNKSCYLPIIQLIIKTSSSYTLYNIYFEVEKQDKPEYTIVEASMDHNQNNLKYENETYYDTWKEAFNFISNKLWIPDSEIQTLLITDIFHPENTTRRDQEMYIEIINKNHVLENLLKNTKNAMMNISDTYKYDDKLKDFI